MEKYRRSGNFHVENNLRKKIFVLINFGCSIWSSKFFCVKCVLNFRGWSQPRNYFNSEIFPIYGTQEWGRPEMGAASVVVMLAISPVKVPQMKSITFYCRRCAMWNILSTTKMSLYTCTCSTYTRPHVLYAHNIVEYLAFLLLVSV